MADRIQKILSQWGFASRRQAEKMILAGRVKLNRRVAKLGDKVDIYVDQLEVDNQVVQAHLRPSRVYLLINKPLGVVSTCDDPQNRTTVLDLLPSNLCFGQGIHPVGRLDINSTGALLLTNDGKLTLNLTHPRYHLPKTYQVTLDNCPTNYQIKLWRRGIVLSGKKTLPATVKVVENRIGQTSLEIVLTEGRNRQIRRVAEYFGYRVLRLHRIAIATITLQNSFGTSLLSGEYRHLTTTEVKFLQNTLKKTANSKLLERKTAIRKYRL